MIEESFYNEDTLFKVRDALARILHSHYPESLLPDSIVSDCINEMQSAGILFRERVRSER